MQEVRCLTQKGIDKLVRLENGVILQIVKSSIKEGVESKLVRFTLADGFTQHQAFIGKQAVNSIPGFAGSDLMYLIVRTFNPRNIDAKGNTIIMIDKMEVVNSQVQYIIGKPIPYAEYKKKGNKNGSNLIPLKKGKSNNKVQTKMEPIKRESLSKDVQKKETNKLSKPPTKSIQPINKKLSPSRNTPSSFLPINDLMTDLSDWTILARIINKGQIRSFVGKKGPSQLMTIQLIDKAKSTIDGIFFGQAVTKFSDVIEVNQVYQISHGTVQLQKDQTGKGSNALQIIFGDRSVFKIHSGKQGQSIPQLEDLAIKISQILDKPADLNVSWDIIALIKQQRPMQMGKTKAGKNMPRKTIVICDPDEKIEIPVTLFFKLAQEKYNDSTPFYLKGIGVGQYQGKKQFSMSFKSSISEMHGFKFRNRKKLDELNFTKGVQQGGSANRQLSNLQKVVDDQQKVTQSQPGWHQVRCFVNVLKTNGTMWYMGCPSCKKKALNQGPFKCSKCNNSFPNPKYYYISNIQVSDSYKSIWVTAYNEVAQVLLDGLKADDAKSMQLQDLRQYAKCVRNKQIRILILSKGQTYEGNFRVKNTISKLIPIDYGQQAKDVLKLIQSYQYL